MFMANRGRGVTDACSGWDCRSTSLPGLLRWNEPALRAALYLVRPDGYVALADPDADPERLRRYFTSRGFATVREHVKSKR